MSNLYDHDFIRGSKSKSTNILFPPAADAATAAAAAAAVAVATHHPSPTPNPTAGEIEPYKYNSAVVLSLASVFNNSSKTDEPG